MEFLDLSDPAAQTVIINFPGRPTTQNIVKQSHRGQKEKYRIVGEWIRERWIGFIGCQQVYHNTDIITHTDKCLTTLQEHTRNKTVIIIGSSAGAGGILSSPIAREIAQGMVLLNSNPCNVWKETVESGLDLILWWIDFYNGLEDYPGNANWAERIAKETHAGDRRHSRIHGTHSLTAEQVLEGVLKSLRSRNYLE